MASLMRLQSRLIISHCFRHDVLSTLGSDIISSPLKLHLPSSLASGFESLPPRLHLWSTLGSSFICSPISAPSLVFTSSLSSSSLLDKEDDGHNGDHNAKRLTYNEELVWLKCDLIKELVTRHGIDTKEMKNEFKKDMIEMTNEFKKDMIEMKNDITELKNEFKKDMIELKNEIRKSIKDMKVELINELEGLNIKWLGKNVISVGSYVFIFLGGVFFMKYSPHLAQWLIEDTSGQQL